MLSSKISSQKSRKVLDISFKDEFEFGSLIKQFKSLESLYVNSVGCFLQISEDIIDNNGFKLKQKKKKASSKRSERMGEEQGGQEREEDHRDSEELKQSQGEEQEGEQEIDTRIIGVQNSNSDRVSRSKEGRQHKNDLVDACTNQNKGHKDWWTDNLKHVVLHFNNTESRSNVFQKLFSAIKEKASNLQLAELFHCHSGEIYVCDKVQEETESTGIFNYIYMDVSKLSELSSLEDLTLTYSDTNNQEFKKLYSKSDKSKEASHQVWIK